MAEGDIASVVDADGYESPADAPAELQNFPLSKMRLNKNKVLYSDESAFCVRISEKTVWPKRKYVVSKVHSNLL